jgi:hypothetical protein
MGFINWLNLRKYIRRGTDAEVARIGHVNAVYDALDSKNSVTSITADGNGPYSGQVAIGVEQRSSINTDYKLKVTNAGSGFTLGIGVPYHEVMGTIVFTSNIGTAAPILEITLCNTIGNGSGDWSIAYETTGSGYQYVLTFSGDNTLYKGGQLFTNPLFGNSQSVSTAPYYLLPLNSFGGDGIDIGFIEEYISESSLIRRVVDINTNEPATFNFHLILPKNDNP